MHVGSLSVSLRCCQVHLLQSGCFSFGLSSVCSVRMHVHSCTSGGSTYEVLPWQWGHPHCGLSCRGVVHGILLTIRPLLQNMQYLGSKGKSVYTYMYVCMYVQSNLLSKYLEGHIIFYSVYTVYLSKGELSVCVNFIIYSQHSQMMLTILGYLRKTRNVMSGVLLARQQYPNAPLVMVVVGTMQGRLLYTCYKQVHTLTHCTTWSHCEVTQ